MDEQLKSSAVLCILGDKEASEEHPHVNIGLKENMDGSVSVVSDEYALFTFRTDGTVFRHAFIDVPGLKTGKIQRLKLVKG
jgi:hypothetical protein